MRKTKYSCNHDFFSHDIPESFYWAGFIAADGTLRNHTKNSKDIVIELAIKDKNHLAKFKDAIHFSGPILDRKTRQSSIIKITSIKIFNDLERFNIVPRKSLTYKFPKWMIDHNLVNHFIRGYIDGDGCFSIENGSKKYDTKYLNLNILGTEDLISNIRYIFNKNCGSGNNKIRPKGNIFSINYGGTLRVIAIRDFIYKNSDDTIRLDRKFDIAFDDNFVNRPKRKDRKILLATNATTKELLCFESTTAAEKAGFNRCRVRNCCNADGKIYKNYTWQFL